MRVALIQFNAGADKTDNIARAVVFVREALKQKSSFVLLPEVFHWRGDARVPSKLYAAAETIPDASVLPFASLAKEYNAHILLGSIFERSSTSKKCYNTSILLNPQGKISIKYRKIHLFDARIGDKIIRESDCFVAGKKTVMTKADDFNLGLSICYDLRFPDLYAAYGKKGVHILTVPSCFTKKTGEAHWETLLRARAIENLSYVLAPNQVGADARGVEAYGNSMIISPWGEVIARGSGDREEIVYGDISRTAIDQARAILPGIVKS